jgi:muconolactone D-isomerase
MLFLVRLEVSTPADWPVERLRSLQEAERTRALDLMHAGVIHRLFRVPGLRGNLGIWHADSLEQLHTLLEELPMWGVLKACVTPIFSHPHETAYEQRFGSPLQGTHEPLNNHGRASS